MFPFASHAVHGYSLEYCAPLLARVGELAKKFGHRLTAHPGQYTQLGSPKPEVVASSVRELEYHCEMMDRMGLGVDSVMIIHGGGMYDDKNVTLGRVKKTIKEVLSQRARARLVLENDEVCTGLFFFSTYFTDTQSRCATMPTTSFLSARNSTSLLFLVLFIPSLDSSNL
jgi:UV DNA damage endonuclease